VLRLHRARPAAVSHGQGLIASASLLTPRRSRDRLVAMVVTQQYLIGELSLLLSNVAAVATTDGTVEEALRLRRRAERSAPEDLTAVVVSALCLTDVLCVMSLSRGDMTAFTAQVEVSRRLYEFGVCSGLFGDL
jgi:hypothetical protein